MTYRVDPCWRGQEGHSGPPEDATIVLVGCGGTGGYLAEALCRLLVGRRGSLHLVDHDRVEERNVARQAFDGADRDRFKSEVLARRLARRFGRAIGYSVAPYDADLHARVLGETTSGLRLIVGCVDNSAARRAIAATLDRTGWSPGLGGRGSTWWCDAGNARNSGQVLLGNVTRPEALRGAFDPERRLCQALPAPSLQRPDLLEAPPAPAPRLDCAAAVAADEQERTVNQAVAALAASMVEKLLAGTLVWMGLYFDLDDGTLRPVPADPLAVAAAVGLRASALAPTRRRAARAEPRPTPVVARPA